MISVLEHKELIDSIFRKYGLSTSGYEIVIDVKRWCQDNDIVETNHFRAAKCLCRNSDGAFHIVFREILTDEMIESAKSSMEYRGFAKEISKLKTDREFLEHLVLHEIACHLLKTTDQESRDKWAFSEMGI